MALENLEEIAVVRLGAAGVALFDGVGNLLADRPTPCAIGVLPSQAILRAGRADDPLGVLVYVVAFVRLKGIFVLGFHVSMADCDGIQFIGSDTAIQEFLAARHSVKRPLIGPIHNWHGKWPVLVSYEEECSSTAFGIHRNASFLTGLGNEISGVLPILRLFPAEYDVLATRAKNLTEGNHVELVGRFN